MQSVDSLEKTLVLGRIGGQEEKGMTENEMAGWHHRLDGHGFGQTPGVGYGQGGLAYCDSWGCRVRHNWTTELNWIELKPSGALKPGIPLEHRNPNAFQPRSHSTFRVSTVVQASNPAWLQEVQFLPASASQVSLKIPRAFSFQKSTMTWHPSPSMDSGMLLYSSAGQGSLLSASETSSCTTLPPWRPQSFHSNPHSGIYDWDVILNKTCIEA